MTPPKPSRSTSVCIVIAELVVKRDSLGEFSALARGFAQECLENEPGCRQFDVVILETTPDSVLFYEAYDDGTAFEAHCRSAHLAKFKAAFPPLVAEERPLRRGST